MFAHDGLFFSCVIPFDNGSFTTIQFSLQNTPDGVIRRATTVVCVNSGTEVPRYQIDQRIAPQLIVPLF